VTSWSSYVEGFHREHAGITEDLLSRATDADGSTPYGWLGAPIARSSPVVDVGCGSGPTASSSGSWIGVDRSSAELALAADRGRGPLVMAGSHALPLARGSADAAVAAMSLMVVDDPGTTLAEVARVLKPGGRVAVLVPSRRPLRLADLARYAALLAVLGRRGLPFPHPDLAHRLIELLAEAGFDVLSDDDRRFECPMTTPEDHARFVRSLYLRGIAPRRVALAGQLVRRWARSPLGIPLRRVIATL